jgi:TolB-like protein
MGRSWRRLLALAGVALVSQLHAQDARPAFAVLPFENGGSYGQDKEIFRALELGIPATISAALAAHPGAKVADPDRVRSAVKSQGLAPAQRVDAATATQIAKATGARYTVTGSFVDFYGKFRINARLVDAESGQILKVVSNDDPKLQDRARLAAIIQSVSEKLAAAAGLSPFPSDATARIVAIPTDALTQFSRGLLSESQGDKAKAAEAFQQALAAYPDYVQAREALQRVTAG